MFDYKVYSFNVEVICRFQKRSFLSSLFKIKNNNKIIEESFIAKEYFFLSTDEIEALKKSLYLMSKASEKIEGYNDIFFLNKVISFEELPYNYILLEKKIKRGDIILRDIESYNIKFFKEILSAKDFLLLSKYLV
jgi:hypothetical protein